VSARSRLSRLIAIADEPGERRSAALLESQAPMEERQVDVKGLGAMTTYLVGEA
jgi:hypothetical protein